MKFQLPTPCAPAVILTDALIPALAYLPSKMTSIEAKIQVVAQGYQESKYKTRFQAGNGPARGFWQFEEGGGVKGVLGHPASKELAGILCDIRHVAKTRDAVYAALSEDDILAAGLARLLLWTDPKRLPLVDDVDAAWDLYNRVWRPGAPHPETWPESYARAKLAVMGV